MTATMARDKKVKPGEEPKKPSRAGTKPLHVYLDEGLVDALQSHLDGEEPRISKTAYIDALIRADLRKRGKWPARPAEGEG